MPSSHRRMTWWGVVLTRPGCPPPHFIPLFIWQYLGKVASYWPSSLMLPSVKGRYLCLLQIGPSLCGECLLHVGFLDLLPTSKRTNFGTENAVGFDIFHLRYILSLKWMKISRFPKVQGPFHSLTSLFLCFLILTSINAAAWTSWVAPVLTA